MNDRPTLETDAIRFYLKTRTTYDLTDFEIWENHSAKLERERDEAREAFVIATDQMVVAQCKLREANKERDEAIESSEAFSALAWKLEGERNEAREDFEEEKKFHHRTHSELVLTQCRLMDVKQAIFETLEENRHLADGDDCTLAKLKSVVPEWK